MKIMLYILNFSLLVSGLSLLISCQDRTDYKSLPQTDASASAANTQDGSFLHETWDQLLKKHVKDGVVNYAGFQRDEEKLDAYLGQLNKTDFTKLSTNQALAFWINAYNAFTVKLILRKYPDIKSIKDIPNRWDEEVWPVNGKKYSLGQIEHEILRKKYNEPRIHFAINCASISCPDLYAEAYRADILDKQLTEVTKAFLNDESKGLKTEVGKTLTGGKKYIIHLSKICSWFSEDFERDGTTVVEYLKPYMPEDAQTFVSKHKDELSVDYLSYDWNLNGR